MLFMVIALHNYNFILGTRQIVSEMSVETFFYPICHILCILGALCVQYFSKCNIPRDSYHYTALCSYTFFNYVLQFEEIILFNSENKIYQY